MRSGDIVASKSGHLWVLFTTLTLRNVADLPEGDYAFVIRADRRSDLIYDLVPVAELTALETGRFSLQAGQRIIYEGDRMVVHRDDDPFVFLRDSEGQFTACWRWELGLLSQLSRPFSILCAEMRQASPEEV